MIGSRLDLNETKTEEKNVNRLSGRNIGGRPRHLKLTNIAKKDTSTACHQPHETHHTTTRHHGHEIRGSSSPSHCLAPIIISVIYHVVLIPSFASTSFEQSRSCRNERRRSAAAATTTTTPPPLRSSGRSITFLDHEREPGR
jgi:hypothetical protein